MNKWKSYLHRWTPGRGRKEGKKNLAQASLSLEPPEISDHGEDISSLRNSISLDPNITTSSPTAIDELLSQTSVESPPLPIDDFNQLIVSSSPEDEDRAINQPINNQSIINQCRNDQSRSIYERRDSNFSTSESDGYLAMSQFNQIPSTDSMQIPLTIPPPSIDKSRQTRDGYIPLDTCSSGKRIASFKLEQEERFNDIHSNHNNNNNNFNHYNHHNNHNNNHNNYNNYNHHNHNHNNNNNHPSLFSQVLPEITKTPSSNRPVLPTKDLYCLESVPPIPTHGPPLPTKLSESAPNRRKMETIHSCDAQQFLPSYEKRNFHHNSFHCFSDRYQNRSNDSNHFGDYVACDANNNNSNNNNSSSNNNNNNNNTTTTNNNNNTTTTNSNNINNNNTTNNNNNNDFFVKHDATDEKLSQYYNSTTVGSLHRHLNNSNRQRRYHGNVSPGALDTKDLLRRPVPPPRSTFARYHSYANEPRSNSFKKNHLEKAKTCVESNNNFRGQQTEDHFETEIRDLPPFPRRAKKTNMQRIHRTTYSDDADSLDGSSNYSNEESGPMYDFKASEDSFNVRFAPKAKSVSKSMYEGRPLPNVEIKYLQLNLQQTPEDISETSSINKIEPEHVSNYREIDWLKTKALMETMHARTKVKGTGSVIST